MGEACGLHEARLVRFLQQLLRERHEAGVLHQAPPLRHLRRQRLAPFLPSRLQGLGEGGVAFCQRRRQISDALGQLLAGGDAVHLRRLLQVYFVTVSPFFSLALRDLKNPLAGSSYKRCVVSFFAGSSQEGER